MALSDKDTDVIYPMAQDIRLTSKPGDLESWKIRKMFWKDENAKTYWELLMRMNLTMIDSLNSSESHYQNSSKFIRNSHFLKRIHLKSNNHVKILQIIILTIKIIINSKRPLFTKANQFSRTLRRRKIVIKSLRIIVCNKAAKSLILKRENRKKDS